MPMACRLHSSLRLLRTFFAPSYPLPSSSLNINFAFLPICLRHFASLSEKSNRDTSPVIHDFLQKSCGLSHSEAIKASKYLLHLKTTENPEKVVCFFRDRGFTDAQIKLIVRRDARVLTSSIPNTLQPKLKLIEDLGTEDGQLAYIITRNPGLVLHANIERTIVPVIAFLRKVVKSDENVITVLRRLTWNFPSFEKMKANLLFLERNGIDEKLAGRIVLKSPRILTFAEAHIREVFDNVDKLGVPRNSAAFSSAMAIVNSSSKDTLERKIDFLVSLGLSKKEVLKMFATLPSVLAFSEKKLKCHMEFLVNILNLEPSITASYPTFFSFSMTKRIMPRYRVFQTLQSMGIVKSKVGFLHALKMSEKVFLDRFVNKHHDESSRLYKIYEGMDPDISTMESQ